MKYRELFALIRTKREMDSCSFCVEHKNIRGQYVYVTVFAVYILLFPIYTRLVLGLTILQYSAGMMVKCRITVSFMQGPRNHLY
jgi:hypothetical protein